jgi:hypothetical protein
MDDAVRLRAVDTRQVEHVDASYRLTGARQVIVVTTPGLGFAASDSRTRSGRQSTNGWVRTRALNWAPTTIRRKQPCFAECSYS